PAVAHGDRVAEVGARNHRVGRSEERRVGKECKRRGHRGGRGRGVVGRGRIGGGGAHARGVAEDRAAGGGGIDGHHQGEHVAGRGGDARIGAIDRTRGTDGRRRAGPARGRGQRRERRVRWQGVGQRGGGGSARAAVAHGDRVAEVGARNHRVG